MGKRGGKETQLDLWEEFGEVPIGLPNMPKIPNDQQTAQVLAMLSRKLGMKITLEEDYNGTT